MTERLSFCLKAAATLTDAEVAALTRRIELYRSVGISDQESVEAAIDDMKREVDAEQARVVALLREQHPDLFRAPIEAPAVAAAPAGPAVEAVAEPVAAAPAPGPAEVAPLTESDAFKAWFRDSKVVDAEGQPLAMYHGTSASEDGNAFTTFDAYASDYGLFGQGAYFTDDPAVASSYTTKGKGKTPTVYKVFLSIQNPIDMDAPGNIETWRRAYPEVDFEVFHEGGTTTNESFYRAAEDHYRDQGLPKWEGAEAMQDGLRAMGHDGIRHIGGGRVKSDGVRHRVFIAFDPEQVKSATGNRGTFDLASADIALSREGDSPRAEPVAAADAPPAAELKRPGGLPLQVASAIADKLAASGIQINVAATVNDMPPQLKGSLLARDPSGVAKGVYFPTSDEVWLIASNLRSPDEMVFVTLHEHFHRGLHITLGAEGAQLLRQLYAANARVRELADAQMSRYGIDLEEAVNEALADLAGSGEAEALNGWQKLVRLVREWVAKMARAASVELEWTDARVLDLVAKLTRAGLNGAPAVNMPETQAQPLASRGDSAFARWFGASKIVDAAGNPRVMYHGTAQDITSFLPKQAGAIFVTDEPVFAQAYAEQSARWMQGQGIKGGAPNIMPVYVSAQRPFDYENPEHVDAVMAHAPGAEQVDIASGEWTIIEQATVQQAIKAAGFDAFYVLEAGFKNLGVYKPTQLKSATGNAGTYDPEDESILLSRGGAPVAPTPADPSASLAGPAPAETALQAAQRKVQDDFIRFKVVRQWAREQGVNLTPDSDVWEFEERMRGRAATRIEDFREKTVQPLVQAVQKAGFTMDQVAEFLHAQHAEERNRQIASIDPENTAGSGMETAEAKEILAKADPALAAVANDFRRITDATRNTLLKAGIISQEMVDAWQGAYQHYVPLKGGDEASQQGTGKALSVNGKQKRALGHGARDEHVIENILRDHERVILLDEKNTVGHSLLAFVMELGNSDIATIDQAEKRKVLRDSTFYEVVSADGASLGSFSSLEAANRAIDKATGGPAGQVQLPGDRLTVRRVKGDPNVAFMARPMLSDNEVQVYVNGQALRVQLNDELLARAYTKLGIEPLNALMRTNRAINGWLSKAYTGLNPEFLLTNVVRDMTAGLFNTTGKFGASVAAKTLANYPKAFASLLRYSWNGKSTPDIDQYRATGSTTGASYLSDIERIGSDIEAAYQDYQRAIELASQGKGWSAAKVASRKLLRKLTSWIEALNAAGEGAMRLSVFEAVRDTEGYTVNDAASAAKNATVNFNRKGEWGPTLGAMYLFFNPAVQGTANMLHTLAHGKHKYEAIGLLAAVTSGVFLLNLNQFDDEEGRKLWKSIPDYVKERNVIVRTGASSYVKVPLDYGYGFFVGLGAAMMDLRTGDAPDKVSIRVTKNLFESLSPISPFKGDSPDSTGLIELVPGFIGGEMGRNALRMMANRDGLGRQIVPESKYDKSKPDHLKASRTTKGTVYDDAATALSKATGGTKSQSGAIEVSPNTLRFWAEAAGGGALKFFVDAGKLGGLGYKALKDPADPHRSALMPTVEEVPVLRRFLAEPTVKNARHQFWARAREIDEATENLRRAMKEDDAEGANKVRRESKVPLAFAAVLKQQKELAGTLRDHIDRINADEKTSEAHKRAARAEAEAREERIYRRFLDAFERQEAKAATAAKQPAPQR